MDATQEKLDTIFPVPAPAPRSSSLTPTRLAGPDPESADALIEALQDNHKNLHIFFNDHHFHNHATHHLLAIYAMGANAQAIKAAYATHRAYQRPAVPPPEPIGKHNWKEHLGDENYYQSYLSFFTEELLEKGPKVVFQDYVFSRDANFVPAKGKVERPNMYHRFLGGLLHPLIHTGYGAEFGQVGMWAEGLAEACVEMPHPPAIVPDSVFEKVFTVSAPDLITRISTIALSPSKPKNPPAGSTHALAILGRIARDPEFSPDALKLEPGMGFGSMGKVVEEKASKLYAFLDEWTVEPNQEDIDKKIEELVWMNTLIYAVGGWGDRKYSGDPKKEFNGDFFSMHFVTSVLLVPSLTTYLPPATAAFFVRTYFLTLLVCYIIQGRPDLPISEFFANVSAAPSPPGPHPTPSTDVCNSGPGKNAKLRENWLAAGGHTVITPNPWLPIIQSTLVHPDEHLCKAQRALLHFSSLLGGTRKGVFKDLEKELPGAQQLDGTLFIRASVLTANRLGWVREGESQKAWDHLGFHHPA